MTFTQPIVAPPGAPTMGMWVEDRYCGLTTWIVAIVGGIPCSYFCPCDRRTVWVSGRTKVRALADNFAVSIRTDRVKL